MGENGQNGDGRALIPAGQAGQLAQQPAEAMNIKPANSMDPEVVALAAAIHAQSDGEISKAQALRAALHFHETGEVPGRHSYISTKGNTKGQVLEGYRAVERYVKQDYQVKYRPLTREECDMHEIQPGDRALACEVYLLDSWRKCINMGIPYQPIVGVTVVRKGDRLNVPSTKTAHWVLQKQARTDALRQVPGMPATVEEAEELAADMGVQLPEGAHLSREQIAAAIADTQRPQSTGRRVDASSRPAGFDGFDTPAQEPPVEAQFRQVKDDDIIDHEAQAAAEFDSIPNATEKRKAAATPATVPTDAEGKVKPASFKTLKFRPEFVAMCERLAAAGIHTYDRKEGGLDYDGACYVLAHNGIAQITDANLNECIKILESRAHEKAQA